MMAFPPAPNAVLFVGGGISSIEAAKITIDHGLVPVIVEQNHFLGGVWATQANKESRIQVDPVSFRPIDDDSPLRDTDPSDPFDNIYPPRDHVLDRLRHSKLDLRRMCVFGVRIERFELRPDKSVLVWARGNPVHGKDMPEDLDLFTPRYPETVDQKEYEFVVKEIHIRTGSLSRPFAYGPRGKPVGVLLGFDKLPGFSTFVQKEKRTASTNNGNNGTQGNGTQSSGTQGNGTQGNGTQGNGTQGSGTQSDGTQSIPAIKLRTGMGDDTPIGEFYEKSVVIVGCGAFAVENVKRALQGGARNITILSRKFNKQLFPERAGYVLRKSLQRSDAFSDASLCTMWRKVHALVKKAAKVGGISHVVRNEHCVCTIDGEEHFIFTNALPSMASNAIFIAAHYNLLTIVEDHVCGFFESGVFGKDGQRYDADIVLCCTGFNADETLFRGHTCLDAFFIDGVPNMTSNVRSDRVRGSHIIGAKVEASNFLISYYEDAQEYERCIRRFIDHPEVFEEFKKRGRDFDIIAEVDYFKTLDLSKKMASMGDPGLSEIFEKNRSVRIGLYEKVLDEEAFYRHDKESWEKLSAFCAKKRGVDKVLAYPFDKVKKL